MSIPIEFMCAVKDFHIFSRRALSKVSPTSALMNKSTQVPEETRMMGSTPMREEAVK